MIEIVSATRLSQSAFLNDTALGNSLRRLGRDPRLAAWIAFANQRGLPEIFNARIRAPESRDLLVFIHDDVWIDDYFFADRILAGLEAFDVIGVAGNRRRVPRQPAWIFIDDSFKRDDSANFSGAVAHGKHPFGSVSRYGDTPAECELLDGVLLAARKSTLVARGVQFDPAFDFHFYDMDFCRAARKHGLRLGTWPICITHQSGGAFGTPQWTAKYQAYLTKWGD